MENAVNNGINYNAVLAHLRSIVKDAEQSIAGIENLIKVGAIGLGKPTTGIRYSHQVITKPIAKKADLDISSETTSAIDATIAILEREGSNLPSQKILDVMIESGRKFESKDPLISVTNSLYKRVRKQPEGRLRLASPGFWGLSDWLDKQ